MNLAGGRRDGRAGFPDLDIIFIESGGDNLAATFSPELADSHIYVIDVGEGDKIPRKGGPGITKLADLLIINKIDFASMSARRSRSWSATPNGMRGGKPFMFTDLRHGDGLDQVVNWIEHSVLFSEVSN